MTDKEKSLVNKFANKVNVKCEYAEKQYEVWDFTYEWDNKKFYCEMKDRNFSYNESITKYPEGLILEMHKYERLLRKSKNEAKSNSLYFNFFNDNSCIVFNLEKQKIKKWFWKTLPETSNFGRRRFVYKYITYLSYNMGKLFYI